MKFQSISSKTWCTFILSAVDLIPQEITSSMSITPDYYHSPSITDSGESINGHWQLNSTLSEEFPLEDHISLGRRLAPLCDEGILVLGSGNVVHNLSRINWSAGDTGYDWADRFDEHVANLMDANPSSVLTSSQHSDWKLAVPTPEHFLPLAYIAGIAAERGESVSRFNYSRTMGSLSMTSYIAETN